MASRSPAPVRPWDGRPVACGSRHGAGRAVIVHRDRGPGGSTRSAVVAIAAAGVLFAVVTYVVALVAAPRLGVGALTPADDGFRNVLLGSGVAVWVVAGLPLYLGWALVRAMRHGAAASEVTGTVVFRGVTGGEPDGPVEYHLAVDDGSTDRVPARWCTRRTVDAAGEGDLVRAVVGRTGRIVQLVVLRPGGADDR